MKCKKCGKNYPAFEMNEDGLCSRCAYGPGANLPGEVEYLKKMGDNILTPQEEALSLDYEETMESYAETIGKDDPEFEHFRKKKRDKNV